MQIPDVYMRYMFTEITRVGGSRATLRELEILPRAELICLSYGQQLG